MPIADANTSERPDAAIPLAGICAGVARQLAVLPQWQIFVKTLTAIELEHARIHRIQPENNNQLNCLLSVWRIH